LPYYPALPADATVQTLTVVSGGTFSLGSSSLTLTGNLTNNGSITGAGEVLMGSSSAQTISGTGTISNLEINKPTGTTAARTVTITSGSDNMQSLTGTLTLTSGTLATNGNLTLKSDATGTARVAAHTTAGTISGNVTVQRYINVNGRPKQWRTLGLPFSGTMTLAAVSGMAIDYTLGRRSVMYYDEGTDDGSYGSGSSGRNAGYVQLESGTQAIPAGLGLMAWLYAPQGSTDPANGTGNMSGDLTIAATGALQESGNAVNMPVTFSGRTFAGWNLLSNPFASAIDWSHNSITKTRVNNAIYRWNPATASWTSWNAGTGTPSGVDAVIESGGAFFVQANAASPVLTIPQTAKVGTSTGFVHFGRVPQLDVRGERAQTPVRLAGVRLSVKGQGNPYPDEVYVDLSRSDATPAFDGPYDAVSMGRTSGAGLAVKDARGDAYAMQFDRPIAAAGVEKRYYPLRVTTPAVGETTLELWTTGSWNPLNSVSLIDTKTGRTLLLRGGRLNYAFQMDSLKAEGRFLLAINHVKVDKETGLPASEMKLLGNPVPGEVLDLILTHPTAQPRQWSVLDMTGRTLVSGRFAQGASDVQHRLPVPGLRTTGSYVLQVEMDNGERRQLRFLKQ
jgi:hypothetical protein